MTLEELASLLQMFHGPSFVGDARPIASQLLGRHPPRAELGAGEALGHGGLTAPPAQLPGPRPPKRWALAVPVPPPGAAVERGLGQGAAFPARSGTEGADEDPAGSPPRQVARRRLPFPWPRRTGGRGRQCPAPAAWRCCGADPALPGPVDG